MLLNLRQLTEEVKEAVRFSVLNTFDMSQQTTYILQVPEDNAGDVMK
jgi:hypothetical protein